MISLGTDGIVRLRLQKAMSVTEDVARTAVDAVVRLSGNRRLPLLVEMAGTESVSAEARGLICRAGFASRAAILGVSPVDVVLSAFARKAEVPNRYFAHESEAVRWLLGASDHPDEAGQPAAGSAGPERLATL